VTHIPSASQTVGPFFDFALTTNPHLGTLAADGIPGERIRLEFHVTDGDGAPARGDCMLEIWQADASGRYQAPGFNGFGRLETNQDGCCTFATIKPGRVEGQAPHINVIVFARGLLIHLHTRVYFDGDPANAADPILALVPEDRRHTLLAQSAPDEPAVWRFSIRLQGEDETVFFDV
jgi:protocatechuate 3,4-dioxygenase alpha subunit